MTAYNTAVLADSPVIYYKLDDFSTQSGSGGTSSLTPAAGASIVSGGIAGSDAASLTGTSTTSNAAVAGALRTEFATLSPNGMTFEFWVKTTSTGKVIIKWGASASTTYWSIETVATTGELRMRWKSNEFNVTSTGSVTDGNWHHVAITVDTSAVNFYIDGAASGSSGVAAGTQASTSAAFYIGSNVSAAGIAGLVDEVAIYNTKLSSTRIAAHYAAGASVSSDYTTTTATSTTQAYDVAVSTPVNVTVDVTTASVSALTANDVTVVSDIVTSQTQSPIWDGTIDIATSVYTQNTTGSFTFPTSNTVIAYVASMSAPVGVVDLKNVKFDYTPSSATDFRVYTITAPFNTASTTAPTLSASYVVGTNGTANITSITDVNNFYGIYVTKQSAGSATFNTKANATSGNRPKVTSSFTFTAVNVDYTADTATLSSLANEVTLTINTPVDVTTVTMSEDAYDVTVEAGTSPDAVVNLTTVTSTLVANDVNVQVPVLIDMDTLNSTIQANDPTVEVKRNAIVEVGGATLSMTAIRPTDVNGQPIEDSESEDVYFVETMRRNPRYWYRGNASVVDPLDNTKTYVPSRVHNNSLISNGVTVGNKNGPNGRSTMYFDGTDYLYEYLDTDQFGTGGADRGVTPAAIEFTIRTTKENQFIMGGRDELGRNFSGYLDLRLAGGKLQHRREGIVSFTGNRNIADGVWHHIVFRIYGGAMEVWIDGALDIRRFPAIVGGAFPGETLSVKSLILGFPDYIGGRIGSFSPTGYSSDIPQSDWFVGDMTEIVYYDDVNALNEDGIVAQYDALRGVIPVRPDTATASIQAYDAIAKGNKTTVLIIDFNHLGVTSGKSVETLPLNIMQQLRARSNKITDAYNLEEYMFFHETVINHIDRVHGGYRLLDLEQDLNMDEYDMIMFAGFPATSDELNYTIHVHDQFDLGRGQERYDKIISDVKDYVVAGKNLYISSPHVAAALGFVSDFEVVPTMVESRHPNNAFNTFDGGYNGLGVEDFDYISATINPFSTDVSLGQGAARFIREPKFPTNLSRDWAAKQYWDNHKNDKYRIRNLVPGLTDIGSWIQTDEIHYTEPVVFADDYFAMKYADRRDGLTIGDEFFYEGTYNFGRRRGEERSQQVYRRENLTFGVPLSAVRAGTVVATFAATIGQGLSVIQNPYRDFATVIAIESGDTLDDGRVTLGKVFMDIGESPTINQFEGYQRPKDIIPSNDQQNASLPLNRRHLENSETRAWDFSTWRADISAYTVSGKTEWILNADGSITQGAKGEDIELSTSSHWWGLAPVYVDTMNSRGWAWLSNRDNNEGNALVGVETATATTKANDVTIVASRNADVSVDTARMNIEATEMADVISPSVTVLVTTPTMTITAVPFTETVDVATATMSMTAYEDQGSILDESEIIGITILGSPSTVILNLKEEV